MSAAGMVAAARASLGLAGRPNYITRDYASRHGSAFLTAPWCDMAITYWARRSGNEGAVLPGGDRAYTPWHATDFQKQGRWFSGTTANVNRAKPGDIVFFDWGGSNSIGRIDHVGVVEKALGGGRVQTIEANTGNACRRRVRSSSVIAGYGRPAYGSASGGRFEGDPLLGLKKGDKGEAVKALQLMIVSAGGKLPRFGVDGDYGDETCEALRQVRLSVGSGAAKKAGAGNRVDPWAYHQLYAAQARVQGKLALH